MYFKDINMCDHLVRARGRIIVGIGCAIALLVVALGAATEPSPDQALPRDPGNVYGRLDNGLRYIVRKNANPPGKVALNLCVRTGALNETDQQNGLAHFIEHMAFNGSAHFKPGELIPLMNKMGMVFGADSNAHTTYHETVYKLTMPDTRPETIDLALTIFADYAGSLTLSSEEIDSERGVILEEARARKSADERLRKQMLKKVLAGSRFAVHDVIGDEEQIKTFGRDTFVDYWNTWYRPENMTVIVVGDIDPADVVARTKEKFGGIRERAPSRQPLDAGLAPTSTPRAFVLTDPEEVGGSVGLMSLRPARPPLTTFAQYRQESVENLAQWIVNRRLGDLIRKGGAPFRTANLDTRDFFNYAEMSSADAEGEPEDWNRMLDALVAEISRAIDHGFTASELSLAKTAALSAAERAVETESTRDSTSIVAGLARDVGLDRPILSAPQQLELTKRVLDTVSTDELHRAFVECFKTRNWNYILTMPEKKDGLTQPGAEDVLAAANAAWAKKTEPPAEQELAGNLLPSEPDAGKVVSQETDNELGLTTSVFANGVVMHHKFTDYRKDQVSLRITLPGGSIEETADTKGLSDLASLMLARPATSRFTSTQVRDLMTGKKVRVAGGIGLDTLSISVSGSNKDLPAGMQLAHAILTDGVLEQSAVDDWKKNTLQELEQMKTSAQGQLSDAMESTIYASDLRFTKLTPSQVNALQRSAAEAWFKRIAGSAAIEVAVVGDIKLEDAVNLVARYVGSLPKRSGDFAALNGLRRLDRKPGPFEKQVTFKSITPAAVVMAGFISCNELDPERRPLSLAGLILSDRMNERIREKEQLVYSIGCSNQPGRGMPGTGVMVAGSSTDPRNAGKLADEVIAMMKDFADKGCTDEELSTAKKQIANQLETQMKEPSFWLAQIAELNYRGRPLSDIRELPGVFQKFTKEQVQDVVRKYLKGDAIVRLVIVPEGAPTTGPATTPAREAQPAGAR